jgi:YesN/AraC family two-component response regulator
MPQVWKADDVVKILVVDDEEMAVEELVYALRAAGFDAIGEHSAAQGLESFLRDNSIGVVVSDVHMPMQDGVEFFQKIRRCGNRGAACGLILMTGFPEVANAIAAVDLRVEKYLLKPIESGEALAATSAAVSSYRKAVDVANSRDLALSTLRTLLNAPTPVVALPHVDKDKFGAVGYEERERQRTEMLGLMLRSLKLRSEILPQELFGDPAWCMLLELALIERSGKRTAVSGLAILAQTSHTTAVRRIQDLVEAGLFVRHDDSLDRRRSYVSLSQNAHERLNQLLDRLVEDQSR